MLISWATKWILEVQKWVRPKKRRQNQFFYNSNSYRFYRLAFGACTWWRYFLTRWFKWFCRFNTWLNCRFYRWLKIGCSDGQIINYCLKISIYDKNRRNISILDNFLRENSAFKQYFYGVVFLEGSKLLYKIWPPNWFLQMTIFISFEIPCM